MLLTLYSLGTPPLLLVVSLMTWAGGGQGRGMGVGGAVAEVGQEVLQASDMEALITTVYTVVVTSTFRPLTISYVRCWHTIYSCLVFTQRVQV